jgi:hypothetical protein
MKLGEIVSNFNLQLEELFAVIETLYDDPKIKKFKLIMRTMNKINSIKIIEQFIIHGLEYSTFIYNKDESFFNTLDQDHIKSKIGETKLRKELHDEGIFQILKLKDYWSTLSDENKDILWEYFQLLTYYAQEYLKLKLANK